MSVSKIAVFGMGKVGELACDLLHLAGFEVSAYDAKPKGSDKPYPVSQMDAGPGDKLSQALDGKDVALSCLPYHLNLPLAQAAHKSGLHYFDLTEDVPTTREVVQLGKSATALMAPQCGLAPGFVGIVGASLIEQFDVCRSLRMRVGALPQNPTGLMGYAFNWSPEGVVNEYLNDCEVIEDGTRKWVSPMEWLETLYIDGVKLEAFTTSGGLGTMCDTYAGRVQNIDYKTIRYPGHMQLMNFYFHELLMRENREVAGKILVNAKPPVNEDVVYVHVSAEGEIKGELRRQEFVRAYRPKAIAGKHRSAIAWTTSSSVVAVIEMVRDGVLSDRGFLKQEDIPLKGFLRTSTGKNFA